MRKLLIAVLAVLMSLSVYAKGWWVPNCEDSSHQHEYHEYTGFQLCYEETYEQPMFVSYHLTNANIKNATLPRKDQFRADPAITTGSAELSDYKGSGYSRGHLAPNSDMAYSTATQSECFYLSNMSPQEQNYFNGGIWLKAEEAVRNIGVKHEDTYVVTGPILDKNNFKTIGSSKVAVPNDYYKIALFCDNGEITEAFAVIMSQTNKLQSTAKGLSFDDSRFIVTIDEVENRTGIDFFPTLVDSVENVLEAQV